MSTILSDLIDAASGDGTTVATLLRKVKVVAARMRTGELEAWVEHELVGYTAGVPLPPYRGPFPTEVRANYAGSFSQMKNGLVPPGAFSEDFRHMFRVQFRHPIVELETFADGTGELQAPWPSDFIVYANALIEAGELRLYEGMGIQSAWQVIPRTQFQAIVDTVRTRILDLGLALEAMSPEAGEPGGLAPTPEQVQHLTMIVNGGSPNIAVGSYDFNQTVEVRLPPEGDRGALFAALAEMGVDREDLDELAGDLDADETDGEERLGSRATAWLGRIAMKTATAATTGGATTVAGLAAKALAAHFGVK